jgi:hypothetical protein
MNRLYGEQILVVSSWRSFILLDLSSLLHLEPPPFLDRFDNTQMEY